MVGNFNFFLLIYDITSIEKNQEGRNTGTTLSTNLTQLTFTEHPIEEQAKYTVFKIFIKIAHTLSHKTSQ